MSTSSCAPRVRRTPPPPPAAASATVPAAPSSAALPTAGASAVKPAKRTMRPPPALAGLPSFERTLTAAIANRHVPPPLEVRADEARRNARASVAAALGYRTWRPPPQLVTRQDRSYLRPWPPPPRPASAAAASTRTAGRVAYGTFAGAAAAPAAAAAARDVSGQPTSPRISARVTGAPNVSLAARTAAGPGALGSHPAAAAPPDSSPAVPFSSPPSVAAAALTSPNAATAVPGARNRPSSAQPPPPPPPPPPPRPASAAPSVQRHHRARAHHQARMLRERRSAWSRGPATAAVAAADGVAASAGDGETGPDEAPIDISQYRRQAQRRLMLSHIRESVDALPELAQVEWEHLDLQALQSALSGVIRTRSALGSDGASGVVTQQQLVALTAMAGAASAMCRGSSGLSDAQIAALPRSTYVHGDVHGDVPACVICHEGYTSGEKLCRLPCSHTYHARCIAKWLSIRRVCPMCRCAVSDC